MDLHFWEAIVKADCALPEGHPAAGLTAELLGDLASPDPHLRDDLAYTILATWISRGVYSPEEMRAIAAQAAANLSAGLGEVGTDTVVLRSFSALILGEVVDRDSAVPFLSAAEVHAWLERAVAYAGAERDVRGYVAGLGWAHAAAHTADLLYALARSRHLDAAGLERVLEAIGARVSTPVGHVFQHTEDERLAYATMIALQRNLVALPFLEGWVDRLAATWSGRIWRTACKAEETASAAHNTRQFLRSLYFQLLLGARPLHQAPVTLPADVREALLQRILAGLRTVDIGFYAAET